MHYFKVILALLKMKCINKSISAFVLNYDAFIIIIFCLLYSTTYYTFLAQCCVEKVVGF